MISVGEARAKLLDLVSPKLEETVPLWDAAGRVLARDVAATRDQPPFAASSMDGYALKGVEAEEHAQFAVIGESAAGHRFPGRVGAGQAVRIFTGAPIPEGTDFVVIQENTSRTGDVMTITADPGTGDNIRPAGNDFTAGAVFTGNKPLAPADVALLAAMNTASEYGFGGVIAALPGFLVLADGLRAIPNPLVNEAVTVSTLAGITGSASGGMSIALAAMADQFVQAAQATGIPMEVLHRVAAMASGGMDTLPHNGAVITLLAVTGLTHREAYRDVFCVTIIKTLAVFFVIAVFYATGIV